MSLLFIYFVLPTLHSIVAGLTNPSCYEVEEKVAEADRNTLIPFPPYIAGVWVSEKCESRTGPEYLLRRQEFSDNDTYSSLVHRYRDLACAEPWLSVGSRGRLVMKGRSWLAGDSAQADFTPEVIVFLPHNQKAADELSSRLNTSCPGLVSRRWRAGSPYTVFSSREAAADLAKGKEGTDWSVETRSCLKPLRLGPDGPSLVRVQSRPPGPPAEPGLPAPSGPEPGITARTELLLGEAKAKGTAFSAPLLLFSKTGGGCEVCSEVEHSTVTSPARLSPPLHAVLSLAGEWVSLRCELRPMGLFLRRRLRVSGRSWQADYNFFSDPSCTAPTLTASAEGSLSLVSSSRIPGAADYDFRVLRAFLTLHEEGLVTSLSKEGNCGPSGDWQLGVRRDVTPSGGCPALGITVPTTEYELVRLELDTSGHALLYLGQAEQRRGDKKERPTSFQPPLLQCNAPELPPLTHFLNSINGVGRHVATVPITSIVLVVSWLM